jgi:hypothetical protein
MLGRVDATGADALADLGYDGVPAAEPENQGV